MQSEEQVERAIGVCYDAIFAPASLPDALHKLARSLDCVCCGFYPRDSAEMRLRLPASHDYRDFLAEFLRDGWWERDHRAKRGWPLAEAGRAVLLEQDVASDEDRRTLPQYHELYPRYDVPWWGAVFFRVDGRLWAVPFLRSSGQGPFSGGDAAKLVRLIPHFERMVRFAGQVSDAAARLAVDALDRLDCAAMLVDWRGAVTHANPRALGLLGAGLSLINGRLAVSDPATRTKLQRLIALAIGSSPGALATQPLTVKRAGRRSLLIDAIPIPDRLADAFLCARAVILITDLDEQAPPSQDRLRAALGLTAAEARLAALVGSGLAPRESAERLGITEETARTTLKRVFSKVGVSRQSQLAALLSRLAIR